MGQKDSVKTIRVDYAYDRKSVEVGNVKKILNIKIDYMTSSVSITVGLILFNGLREEQLNMKF